MKRYVAPNAAVIPKGIGDIALCVGQNYPNISPPPLNEGAKERITKMIFKDRGDKKEIIFEKDDTLAERRILENGLALIRDILMRIIEVERKKEEH